MMRSKRVLAILVLLMVTGVVASFSSLFSPAPVVVRFLRYTNNTAGVRVALLEITNRSNTAFAWHLRSDARTRDFILGLSDLMETNGELRNYGGAGSFNIFERDFLQFTIEEFRASDRIWVELHHYPKTAGERRRQLWADWIERRGLRQMSIYVRAGLRVTGPVLPKDT